jgi:diadenosine tetraphosphate (Ap4A) HIT family hydrolase
MEICYTCLSNSGERRISPGKSIFNGNYWIVEHSYPTGLLGWIVIVLKRHCEELNELNDDEWNELSIIQRKVIKLLHMKLGTTKEYIACFAEAEGFKHIHFHVIPRTKGMLDDFAGTKVFKYLKVIECDKIKENQVSELCDDLYNEMNQ